MLPILVLIPLFTSLVLGLTFVLLGDARPRTKGLAAGVFALAAYLQFFTRFSLAGLLLQAGLAVALLMWRRFDSSG